MELIANGTTHGSTHTKLIIGKNAKCGHVTFAGKGSTIMTESGKPCRVHALNAF